MIIYKITQNKLNIVLLFLVFFMFSEDLSLDVITNQKKLHIEAENTSIKNILPLILKDLEAWRKLNPPDFPDDLYKFDGVGYGTIERRFEPIGKRRLRSKKILDYLNLYLNYVDDSIDISSEIDQEISFMMRSFSASALDKLGYPHGVPYITYSLRFPHDSDTNPASYAVIQMLGIRSKEASTILLSALREELKKPARVLDDGTLRMLFVSIGFTRNRSKEVVDELLEALKYDDSIVREYAAVSLGMIGDKKAIQSLIERLNDNSIGVRISVVDSLAELGDPASASAIIKALNEGNLLLENAESEQNKYLKTRALIALRKLGNKDAIPYLKKEFYEDNDSKIDILAAIAQIDGREEFLELLSTVGANDDFLCRLAGRLGKAKAPFVISFLINGLMEGGPQTKQTSANSLATIGVKEAGDLIVNAIKNSEININENIITYLGDIEKKEVVPFLKKRFNEIKDERLTNPEDYSWTYPWKGVLTPDSMFLEEDEMLIIMKALGKIGTPEAMEFIKSSGCNPTLFAYKKLPRQNVITDLKKLLSNGDVEIRISAARIAGDIVAAELTNDLIKALDDEYYNVREKAAYALGKIGGDKALQALLKPHEDRFVQAAAARSLGEISDVKAVPRLSNLLIDDYYQIRREAATALGKIGDKTTISLLTKLLSDEDYEVRIAVAKALGMLGSKDALPALEKALDDYDWEVRETAAAAIENIRKK